MLASGEGEKMEDKVMHQVTSSPHTPTHRYLGLGLMLILAEPDSYRAEESARESGSTKLPYAALSGLLAVQSP